MIPLLVQIGLLLLAAYVLGAIIGCMAQRLVGVASGRGDVSSKTGGGAAMGVQPVIEASGQTDVSTSDQARFERALSRGPGDGGASTDGTGGSPPDGPVVETGALGTGAVKLDTPAFSPVEEPGSPVAELSSPVEEAEVTVSLPSTPAAAAAPTPAREETVEGEEGEPFTSVSVAAAAAAAAIAVRSGSSTRAGEEAPSAVPVTAVKLEPSEDAAGGDDLTRIKGLDETVQARLYKEGVSKYGHIARWQSEDVAEIEAALSSPGRVSRENWIEQAKILSDGGLTAFARDKDAGVGSASDGGSISGGVAARDSNPATGAQSVPSTSADQGVMAAAASAAAAATLATAVSGASFSADRPASRDGGEDSRVHEFEEIGTDPLHKISGIDERIAGLLNGLGITRFEQIANWSESDVAHFEDLGASPGQVGREHWVEQAGFLARGEDVPGDLVAPSSGATSQGGSVRVDRDETAAGERGGADRQAEENESRTERPARADRDQSSDMSGFRSVRSAALRGQTGAAHSGEYDDLKRIRGVGVLIEKKLNSLGVTSYEQVANWTKDEIDRISHLLEFKGRIERENWVEQARILSSGGQTEFSRRLERGSS